MLQVNIEKILPVTEARDMFNKIVDDVEGTDELWVLTKNGKPAAVMVGVNHLEKLTGEAHVTATMQEEPKAEVPTPAPAPAPESHTVFASAEDAAPSSQNSFKVPEPAQQTPEPVSDPFAQSTEPAPVAPTPSFTPKTDESDSPSLSQSRAQNGSHSGFGATTEDDAPAGIPNFGGSASAAEQDDNPLASANQPEENPLSSDPFAPAPDQNAPDTSDPFGKNPGQSF